MRRPLTSQHRASIYRDAIEILDAEYDGELRLDDVAHRIAASRRQVQRAFTEIGATTFRGHLAEIRMQHAAELLAMQTLPVGEVARRVGYPHAAQFAKVFRRHHALTPSAFRELAQRDR